MARELYGNTINYKKVVVHCDSYFPFGAQSKDTAMAPNGELWFRSERYQPDFSAATIGSRHTFIHEMAHVWQRERGMWVRTRGLFSDVVDYRYRLDGKKKLKDYGMEQQASIIADYWLWKKHGNKEWLDFAKLRIVRFLGVSDKNTFELYEYTLSDFFKQRG